MSIPRQPEPYRRSANMAWFRRRRSSEQSLPTLPVLFGIHRMKSFEKFCMTVLIIVLAIIISISYKITKQAMNESIAGDENEYTE